MIKITDSVDVLKGIGPRKQELLSKLNINTLEDFLYFFPRHYQDRRYVVEIADLKEDMPALIRASVIKVATGGFRYRKKSFMKVICEDQSGTIEIVFFNAGFLTNIFKQGVSFDFYGKPRFEAGMVKMIHPDFSKTELSISQGIIPIYSLTTGITQSDMQKYERQVGSLAGNLVEYLPKAVIARNRLCSISYAIKNIHFPIDEIKLKEARFRLVFEELLVLQTGLLAKREIRAKGSKSPVFPKDVKVDEFISSLQYNLTGAQKRVISEVMESMESPRPMNRLVQGDVGSGKTVIAETALYKAVKSGYQGVMMAPTELLAKQHYASLKADLEPHGINVYLLISSLNNKDKQNILDGMKIGEIQVVVGTHAVIQSNVVFYNLGIVITDEQHRFGVNQRLALTEKGENVDTLVMTATPIPRTLAAIIYGDLDISIIDEMPPGRRPIITKNITSQKARKALYAFVKSEIQAGRQCYVVTPLIEESDVVNARSASEVYTELSEVFREFSVSILHGGMKPDEKERAMEAFSNGSVDVLVSTVVIEVGINVPNATVMVVENAERFGLAQLHQLRGRVGRGEHQSYCFLVTDSDSSLASARAEIMVSSGDGFYIAEKDLELRGPGEFFGTKQHGLPELSIADLVKHIDVLEKVRDEAKLLLAQDPKLEHPDNRNLKKKIEKLFVKASS